MASAAYRTALLVIAVATMSWGLRITRRRNLSETVEGEDEAEEGVYTTFLATMQHVLSDKNLLSKLSQDMNRISPTDETEAFSAVLKFVWAQMPEEMRILEGKQQPHHARHEQSQAREHARASSTLGSNHTSQACSQDTGGTCRISDCNAWRNARCVSEGSWWDRTHKCKCSDGMCAVDGICVPNDPLYMCGKDTGGSCSVLDCNGWRSASCGDGKCLCRADQCAIEGHCVPVVPDPAPVESVAVVGCGVAGALTALELAHQGKSVTVIDREAGCGVGTSGRIAAEMMFYQYHKAFWAGEGLENVEGMVRALLNLHGSGNVQGLLSALYWALEQSSISGSTDEVELRDYTFGDLEFRGDSVAPIVTRVAREGLPDVTGKRLEKISGLSTYEIVNMAERGDINQELQRYLASAPKPLTLKFVHGEDARTNDVYEAAFFQAAGQRLRDFYLVHYPELCEAVITPFCCEPGTAARAWVEANTDKAGYVCPADPFAPSTGDDPGMGVVHTFVSQATVERMAANRENAHLFDWELWDQNQTDTRLNEWLLGTTMYGAAMNRLGSGFVRTELLFPIIKQILEAKGAVFDFRQQLSGISLTDAGKVIVDTTEVGGEWRDIDGVRTFFPSSGSGETTRRQSYDRIVISTGAAVGSALDALDPALHQGSQLQPIFGFIVLGREGQMRQKATGVVFEDYKMYLRSTRDGRVAIGGGMFFADGTDDDVRELSWMDGFGQGSFFDGNAYMSQAEIGENLVNDHRTVKMAGCRPASLFGRMPLIKSYRGGRVILNTGGGANGFVTSWLASKISADLALSGAPAESIWHAAFTEA